MSRNSQSALLFVAGVIVLSTIAFATGFWATRHGLGLSADSAMYIGGARGLVALRGYGMYYSDGWFRPIVTYMPALPALIAVVSSMGVNDLNAARWIIVSLFGLNVAALATVIWFNTARSTPAAWMGAALFCASPVALGLHVSLVSEALFTFCLVLAIGVLASVLKRPGLGRVFACGMLLGCAYLTRYAALAFIGSAGLATLLFLGGPWKRRAQYAVVLAAACALVIVPWMIRNHLLGVAAVGRPAAWHPISLVHFKNAAQTLGSWVVPADLPWGIAWWIVYGAALVAGAWIWIKLRASHDGARSRASQPLAQTAALMAVAYAAFLIVSISIFDAQIPLDSRILSPLFLMLLLGACTWIGNAPKAWRYAVLPPVMALLLISICGTVIDARQMRDRGMGFGSRAWKNSKTIQALSRIPAETMIYSNGWDVIYAYTGRHTSLLPLRTPGVDPAADAGFNARMQKLGEELKARRAVLVWLRSSRRSGWMMNEAELVETLSLRRLERYDDGTIYVWQRPPKKRRAPR